MSTQSRRRFLKNAAATAATVPFFSRCAAAKKQPNIVFVFSDQQHWHALGCLDDFFDTPHQDAFAQESVHFENAFCTTPQCSASRSSILTGLYPHKTGVFGNMGAAGGEPLHQSTFIKAFHDHGYATAYVGKWHLGDDPVPQQDFDHFVVFNSGSAQHDSKTSEDGLKLLRNPEFFGGPFVLFISYVDPHDIYHFRDHVVDHGENIPLPTSWQEQDFSSVPSIQKQFMTQDQGVAIWGEPEKKWRQYRDYYRAKVKLYDDHFGAIIAEIKNQGLWEDTIVVNTSDHGDMDTHNHLIWKGPFMYEHMVRVPMMIRLPEKFGGHNNRRITDLEVVNVDFAPTLLDLCGLPLGNGDGLSLAPTLRNRAGQKRRDYVISEYYSKQKWVNPIRMIRTTRFKYNTYIPHGEELYDLKNDPDEVHNLANDPGYMAMKKELATELDKWMKENDDPFYSLFSTDRRGKRL